MSGTSISDTRNKSNTSYATGIPDWQSAHYKPRGKMVYFAKEELDEWLLQNYEPTVNEAVRMATEAAATEPFLNKRRNGKRKKD